MQNNPSTLLAKLRTLQCHFTWDFAFEEQVDVELILKYLALRQKHTPFKNRATYMAMTGFLYTREKRYAEALETMYEAESAIRNDHPTNVFKELLVTLGNCAWIYYHATNYDMAYFCLKNINRICQSMFSPHPYSVDVAEIHAQKGWSLLVGGFHNGMKAANCFLWALRKDKFCLEYHTGLALSAYACWATSQDARDGTRAKKMLEGILYSHPENDEVKVYLASLFLSEDQMRVNDLLAGVVEHSLNAEVLRTAANLCLRQSLLPLAIAVLKEALRQDPAYPLLHYDLGIFYRRQMEAAASPEEKTEALSSAIASFQRAVELDPLFVDSKLELAKLYGENSASYEEEIYRNLLGEVPRFPKRCQQAFYLHWGDFLRHKKGLKHEAWEQYMAGLRVSGGQVRMRGQLRKQSLDLARAFQADSDAAGFAAIRSFLETCRAQSAQGGDLWWFSYRAWR